MGNISKWVSLLFFVILVVSSLIIITPAFAQSIIKSPVPEFTAKLVDLSYDVAATTTIDPYTGQTVNHPAHRVENYTIDLTIKNQPYMPTVIQEGTSNWTTSFNYNIHVKGHFAQDWISMYYAGEGPKMSNSLYTVVTYVLVSSPTQPDQGYTLESLDTTFSANSITGLPPGGQIDFQVDALSGYWTRTTEFNSQHFVSEDSGWSNTQTITIPTTSTSPSPTPTVPESQLWTIPILLIMAVAVMLVYFKKTNRLDS